MAAIPRAGGEYAFLSKLYHPAFGFLSGWVSFVVGFSAPIAASSIGFTEYFTRACPQIIEWGNGIGISNPMITKKFFSILIIVIFTGIHLRGIEFGTRVQNYLTILKVGLVVGLIVIGFSTRTCFSACNASLQISKCVSFIVQMLIASTSDDRTSW